ncbi:ABC transporter permease [bacterium]|nr:ABC transporter permease [bacterium]
MSVRNISRNRRRTLLALGAVVVGLCALTLLRGFVNSVRQAQLAATLYGTTGMVQIHRAGYLKNVLSNPLDLSFADTQELREKILSVAHVVAISPRLQFSGSLSATEPLESNPDSLASTEPKTTFIAANAVDPVLDRKVMPQFYEWLIAGAAFDDAAAKAMVVHRDVAGPLGLDDIQKNQTQPADQWPVLLAPDVEGSLSGEAVQVTGVLGSAVPTDKRLALAPLKTIQKLLKIDNKITEYLVRLDSVENAVQTQSRLTEVLGPEFEVSRWDEIAPFIKDVLENIDRVFGFVTAVFLLVIMLGIVNSMFMNVLERVREIGTMMALGIRRGKILSMFVLEGAILGGLGAFVALAIGYILVSIAAHIGIRIPAPGSTIKFVLHPFLTASFVLESFLFTTLGAALVSLWPAYRASRLRPVEALSAV